MHYTIQFECLFFGLQAFSYHSLYACHCRYLGDAALNQMLHDKAVANTILVDHMTDIHRYCAVFLSDALYIIVDCPH